MVDKFISMEFTDKIDRFKIIIGGERLRKKEIKLEYQLLFELLNNLLVPKTERRSIASIIDFFLIEVLNL